MGTKRSLKISDFPENSNWIQLEKFEKSIGETNIGDVSAVDFPSAPPAPL
jgi:hypothetical protein